MVNKGKKITKLIFILVILLFILLIIGSYCYSRYNRYNFYKNENEYLKISSIFLQRLNFYYFQYLKYPENNDVFMEFIINEKQEIKEQFDINITDVLQNRKIGLYKDSNNMITLYFYEGDNNHIISEDIIDPFNLNFYIYLFYDVKIFAISTTMQNICEQYKFNYRFYKNNEVIENDSLKKYIMFKVNSLINRNYNPINLKKEHLKNYYFKACNYNDSLQIDIICEPNDTNIILTNKILKDSLSNILNVSEFKNNVDSFYFPVSIY